MVSLEEVMPTSALTATGYVVPTPQHDTEVTFKARNMTLRSLSLGLGTGLYRGSQTVSVGLELARPVLTQN